MLVAGSPPLCRAGPHAACLASPRAALQSRMSLLPQELESQISQHSISFDCMEVRRAALLCGKESGSTPRSWLGRPAAATMDAMPQQPACDLCPACAATACPARPPMWSSSSLASTSKLGRASLCCRRSRCRRTWRSSTTACRPHGARQGFSRVPPALCNAALQRGCPVCTPRMPTLHPHRPPAPLTALVCV